MRALLIVVFGFVCLAGFYLAFEQNRIVPQGTLPEAGVAQGVPPQYGGLIIEKRGAETIRLEGEGEEWLITSPLRSPADRSAVEKLLESLEADEALALIQEADPEEFGFKEPPWEIRLLAPDGETVLRTVQVGHLDGERRARYVRDKGETTARLVSLDRIAEMTPDLPALRDRSLLRLDPAGLREISREGPEGGFKLVRQDRGWTLEGTGEPEGGADPDLVEEALEGLSRAALVRFAETTPPDQRALTLRLAYPDRRDWLRLWFQDREGDLIYGRSSWQPSPFLASSGPLASLTRPAREFADRRLLVFDPGEAARVVLVRQTDQGLLRLVAEKSPRAIWRVIEQSREAPEVSQERASALPGEVARIRYVSAAQEVFSETALTIRVESGKGELLAGLHVGLAGDGSVLGHALMGERAGERCFVLEPEVFRGLPGPWALTNRN